MTAVCEAAETDGKNVSVFDNVWSYAILYEDEDNRFIQKIALSGRLQPDSAWFDADEGHFNDELWRRFRFGFKSDVFRNWVVHLEGDFNLNNKLGEMYTRLTDAYIGWSPTDNLTIKALKQSAGFTLDGATSSKKLLTMQRNNLTNNLWFTSEYFTGLLAKGDIGPNWSYQAGVFSSDGSDELSQFEASYFTLASLGYHFIDSSKLDKGLIRVDYVYNDEDVNADTRDFSQVLSLVTQWEIGPWGLWTDISAGKGYAEQSDVWGMALLPFYNFNKHIQTVLRYTYLSSKDDNGLRLGRYEREIVEGRGNEYNEIYGGINIYFYGQKFKWQTGLQYTTMEDDADDEGKYEGWGLSTGLRLYW
jgi:phosphate-selective porin OprO/OprP